MKIIAHRGNHGSKYNQNTKENLLSALGKNYVDGIELDIRITKDKKIVIIHDFIINLVSDGMGIVKDMTLKELYKYNFGTKQNPTKISTLNNFLKQVYNDKIILIEIKEGFNDEMYIADRIMKVTRKYPDLNIYICSFNYKIIKYLNDKYNYRFGLIIGLGLNENKIKNNFHFNIVTPSHLNKIDKNKETFVWDVLVPEELIKKAWNKVYIITNHPKQIYSLIISQLQK